MPTSRARYSPIGLVITVGGVGTAAENLNSLFSEQTLIAYTSLYTEPREALSGIVERLAHDAVREGLKAEAVLLLGDRDLAAPSPAGAAVDHDAGNRGDARRRSIVTVVALVIGSILVPEKPKDPRYPVAVTDGGRFSSLTVDSVLLADVLDRGIEGIRLLSARQQRAVKSYLDSAAGSLSTQLDDLPKPGSDETMILGFSDLHCNQAMTELISRLAHATQPSMVLSSGDDTVNGTAAERGCIRREAAIPDGVPFLVATGNHDSDVTEAQMRSVGMTVLDGQVVEAAGLSVLGDDDPEHNIPFSVDRVKERPESEEEMAQRLVDVRPRQAHRRTAGPPACRRASDHERTESAGTAGALGSLPRPVRSEGDHARRRVMDGRHAGGHRRRGARADVHLLQHAVLPAADQRRRLLLLPRQRHGPDHRSAAGALPTGCKGCDRGPHCDR